MDEPFSEKEKRVVNICLHGLNSDRTSRPRRVISPWPWWPGRISWFSLGKRTLGRQKSDHIFYWPG